MLGTSVVLILAIIFAYISTIGFALMKFVSAKVEFNDHYFQVEIRGAISNYKWADIASIKNHHGSQVLELLDSTGRTIYAVDHMTPGYDAFFAKIQSMNQSI